MATLIGDVVGSRRTPDRAALHARLESVLRDVNERLGPVVPLRITVGDEFQGCFASVGEALHATLLLRLGLAPEDLRHGVGWGTVTVLGSGPRVEDGPGWWAAREAIDEVKREATRAATREVRTAYRLAVDTPGPDPRAVNAALMCRDQMVGSAAMRSGGRPVRVLRAVLEGRTQAQVAAEEQVSPSAVSQSLRTSGLAVVVAADALLREVR